MPRRLLLALPLLWALSCTGTLYDAAGLLALEKGCSSPGAPIACGDVCSAEDADHCGPTCAVCPALAHAARFCDQSSPDLAQHRCAATCDPGFEPSADPLKGCGCPANTNLCGGDATCQPEGVTRCGPACESCSAPLHASAICAVASATSASSTSASSTAARACGFDCAPTFERNAAGTGCQCPAATPALCQDGSCHAQDVGHCGPGCLACATGVAHATAACEAGSGTCGFACNPPFELDAAKTGCQCPSATPALCQDGACHAQDAGHCGSACLACSTTVAHAAPSCDAAAGTCGFTCDAAKGFQKNAAGDACVCGANHVACGADGSCVPFSNAACGATCAPCAVSPAFAATGATPSCTAVGVCDYLCPGGLNKCSGGCCAPACGAGLVACGGGAGGTCVVEDATACGPSCTHCPAGPVNGAAVCTAAHTCDVLCNTGTFRCGTSAAPACCSVAATPAAVALGGQHTCIIAEDTQGQNAGQVLCWGANDQGQLGDGTNVDRLAPVRVDLGGALAVAIAAGASHTCAALSGGGVKCWGSNSAGQLGVPASLASSHTPLDAAVTGVAASGTPLAAGSGHTCAVVAGGAVRCWGASSLGQLGNGSLSAALGPQQAGSLSGVGALTAGGDHTCALAAGGVWCWGANESGQVGGGSFATPVSSPTSVAFGAGISIGAVATGQAHSCAAVASGANARCWGLNAASQLGTKNNTASSASPVSAGSLDNRAVLVAAGAAHTCAAAQGVVTSFKCIGGPGIGLAGVGETIDVLLPAAERLLRLFASGSVVSAGAGGQFGCMLVEPAAGATGAGPFRLWCWGVNDRGQFGNGATSTAPTPLAVQPVGQ